VRLVRCARFYSSVCSLFFLFSWLSLSLSLFLFVLCFCLFIFFFVICSALAQTCFPISFCFPQMGYAVGFKGTRGHTVIKRKVPRRKHAVRLRVSASSSPSLFFLQWVCREVMCLLADALLFLSVLFSRCRCPVPSSTHVDPLLFCVCSFFFLLNFCPLVLWH